MLPSQSFRFRETGGRFNFGESASYNIENSLLLSSVLF